MKPTKNIEACHFRFKIKLQYKSTCNQKQGEKAKLIVIQKILTESDTFFE